MNLWGVPPRRETAGIDPMVAGIVAVYAFGAFIVYKVVTK